MRILEIVHGFRPTAQGGAELYAEMHANALARLFGDEVRVFTREADFSRPDFDTRSERRDGLEILWVNNTFRSFDSFEDSYLCRPILERFGACVDEFRPEIAHVHHLSCLSTQILDELARRGVPIVFTLHDYWMACLRGQLLDVRLERCAGPSAAGCATCLEGRAGRSPALRTAARFSRAIAPQLPASVATALDRLAVRVTARLARPDAVLASAQRRIESLRRSCSVVDRWIAPSSHIRERFVRFGLERDRILLSSYGIDHRPFAGLLRAGADRLRIGFLGSLMVSKGPDVLLRAFRRLPPGSASLDLFGAFVPYHGDTSFRAILDELLAWEGVTWHGPAPPESVPEVLARLDLLVVPSVWEENSPISIREAFLAGVPVVGSSVGGIPELVEDGRSGLLVPPGDDTALGAALARVATDPALLERLRAGLPRVRTIDDEVSAMRSVYGELVGRSAGRRRAPA